MVKSFLGGMRLPVNPLEDITFSVSSNNKTFELVGIGEVSKIGSKGLIKTDIKSLFTGEDYPFADSNTLDTGQDYVDRIYEMMDAEQPVPLIITGDGIDINMSCSIDVFKPSIHFGETKDRYYTLSLREHKDPLPHRIKLQPDAKKATKTTAKRSEKKPAKGSYTVKKGDSLWAIAKKHYGDGTKWPQIYSANKGTVGCNPNYILPGQTLTLP